jgi:hypothetical protein
LSDHAASEVCTPLAPGSGIASIPFPVATQLFLLLVPLDAALGLIRGGIGTGSASRIPSAATRKDGGFYAGV